MMYAGLLVLLGVIPSLLLSLFAGLMFMFGMSVLFRDPQSGSLLVFWSVAGLYGAWALINASFDRWTDNSAPGLIAGILAVLPLLYWTSNGGARLMEAGPLLVFLCAPIIAALVHIYRRVPR